ncbi:MAG TPA: hypothetical protein VMV10_03625 [Pirellulales bacterium]|nr:hypothetical protein [Pirellulales bacterium]
MNEHVGHSKTRLLFGLAALLLTGFVSASVVSLMFSKYPAIGAVSFIGFTLVLPLFLATGLVCSRGKLRAFCLGAALPAAIGFYSAALILETLFKQLPPQWPPEFADFDEQILNEANRSLGTAILASIALGYYCVVAVWLAERLRQAGVRPRLQFRLKTVFIVTTFAGFAASAAARISPANAMQFYLAAFCAGCVAAVGCALYIAALLVPPIKVRAGNSRNIASRSDGCPSRHEGATP